MSLGPLSEADQNLISVNLLTLHSAFGPGITVVVGATERRYAELMETISTSSSLLDGIRSGRSEAWTRFVKIYAPFVYGRCRRCQYSEIDAHDIAQDVFVRIHGGIARYRPDGEPQSFSRWFARVITSALMDFGRKAQRFPQVPGGSGFLGVLHNTPDEIENSVSITAEADRLQLVRNALRVVERDFEPRTWRAFLEHGINERPAPEVARETGISADAVRQAKRRVLQRLKSELEGLVD